MGERQTGPLGLELSFGGKAGPGFKPGGQQGRKMVPGPLGTPDYHVAVGHNRKQEKKHHDPPAVDPALEKFKKDLIAMQEASRLKDGKVAIKKLEDADLSPIPGTKNKRLHRTVLPRFVTMWNELLDAHKERADATTGDLVDVASAYRSSAEDALAWEATFQKFKKRTQDERLATGDEYGPKSLKIMYREINGKKAPPGFSGHTHGIATDLMTTENGQSWVVNSDYDNQIGWQKTWLFKWLVENAGKHHFYQLKTETWHWEYHENEEKLPKQCWGGEVSLDDRPVPKPTTKTKKK